MKIRESGMPDQKMWEGFFRPERVLAALELDARVTDAAEFGCGYGTFTIPAARIVGGKVYAMDIDPDMVRTTREAAEKESLTNIQVIARDFMAEGSGLPDASVDYVMLFNILHLEEPMLLMNEAARILKKNGKLAIIHWNHDPATPRGPSMTIRPKPEDCIKWAASAGFKEPNQHDLKPYHYGIVLTKGDNQK